MVAKLARKEKCTEAQEQPNLTDNPYETANHEKSHMG